MKPPPRPKQQELQDAIALLQQGQFAAGEAALLALLKSDPRHFDALHLAGVAAAETGRLEEAINRIRRALAINPRSAAAHGNLGSTLIRLGRHEEALPSLDRALALNPDAAGTHHNRGFALMKLKRLDQAIAAFDRAIALQPDYAPAHNDRAGALSDQQRHEEALEGYRKALSLRPHSTPYLVNVALALCGLQRHAEALPLLEQALRTDPKDASALIGHAQALLALGRPADGLAAAEKALAVNPGLMAGHLWRSNALVLLGQPEAALAAADAARSIAPQDASAHRGYGFALGNLNRLEDALFSYDQALKLDPDDVETLWNKALALLALGRFEEGWLAYEYRNLRRKTRVARKYPQPLWWGKQGLKDQQLYIYWEQGLGDTIQFARYALLAAAAGAKVILSVQEPLRRIFRDFDPAVTIIGQNDEPAEFDVHCPLLSLPLAFGTRLETIPAWPNGYLKVPAEEAAHWAARLPQARRRIGLVWSGSAAHGNDANRSIALSRLSALFQPGDAWISLQKEVRANDQAALNSSGLMDLSGQIGDFADTAAIIAGLDLVVSVDTSVAHLAAALGKPVWLMVPFAPDFRWLLSREDTPWYPSMRLFRQTRAGDWDQVVARVAQALNS
ncbi:MAG: tetratricopeptide repeat protein, partial [Alphaproteobacteria bacterium]